MGTKNRNTISARKRAFRASQLPRLSAAAFPIDDRLDDRLGAFKQVRDGHDQRFAGTLRGLLDRLTVAHCTRLLDALAVPFPILAPQHDPVAGCDRASAAKDARIERPVDVPPVRALFARYGSSHTSPGYDAPARFAAARRSFQKRGAIPPPGRADIPCSPAASSPLRTALGWA